MATAWQVGLLCMHRCLQRFTSDPAIQQQKLTAVSTFTSFVTCFAVPLSSMTKAPAVPSSRGLAVTFGALTGADTTLALVLHGAAVALLSLPLMSHMLVCSPSLPSQHEFAAVYVKIKSPLC